jgi:glycolate oxidase iron-sulfur subunit
LVEPVPAEQLMRRKVAHVLAANADLLATANPGCLLQIQAGIRRTGLDLPAVHPIELVDASIRGQTLSLRRKR